MVSQEGDGNQIHQSEITHMNIPQWKIIPVVFGVLICGCTTIIGSIERQHTVASVDEFETYLNNLVDSGTPQGMSFVVVNNGKVIYKKGFGWADRPREIAATSESIYHWWSITKIVTAIAILQLQEQGKLQLDDSVAKFLPFFKVHYPSVDSKVITIHHLLNHSSGLPDAGFRIMSWIHHDGEPSINQTVLVEKELPHFSKLVFEPGDHSEYTNIGYMVLGAIIEKVTGQTYEAYIRGHILQPLRMNHTDFQYTQVMEPYEAAGSHPIVNIWTPLIPVIGVSYIREISGSHFWLERVYTDQTPPSGLIGSAADAARLVTAYLNGGELDGQRILTKESIARMTYEGYINGRLDDSQRNRKQGIGWQVYNPKGYNPKGRFVITHDGGGLGFSTKIQLYPDENLGFVLFTNDVTCEGWKIINVAATLQW
jgi:D-alanyl-D-alanine carboxypeptidase